MVLAIVLASVAVMIVLARLTSASPAAMAGRRRTEGSDRVLRTPQPDASMGRDRVASQWYMNVGDDAPSPPAGGSLGSQAVPRRTIRWWVAGAGVYGALDVVAWVSGYPVLGVIVAALGAFALGMALRWQRRNHWLEQAKTWSTGHHHDIPPERG